jgi:putative PEP-CTERM system histidine kinase
MNLLALGYLFAAAWMGWLAVFMPRAVGFTRRTQLRLGLAICTVWSVFVAAYGTTLPARGQDLVLLIGAVVRYGGLLLVLGALSNAPRSSSWQRLNLGAWLVALAAAVLGAGVLHSPSTLSIVGLMLASIGLVNVEQLLRAAGFGRSRAMNLCAVGLGGQFAYDLFMFSQAQLLGGLDEEVWVLRGVVLAVLTPIAGLGIRRLAGEQPTVFVSRQVVFYTTAVLSVGVYLLLMALGGYYVRAHGGSWGESLRVLFIVGAGIVLAMLMLSRSMWRRLRVFVAKHFYRNKYDYRAEWLRFIATLSSPDSPDARRTSIRAIAQILESPGGVLFLANETGMRFEPVATWSAEGNENGGAFMSLDAFDDLPRFLTDSKWVVDIEEYRRSPGLYRDITLPEAMLGGGWRIITPLLELDRLIGFLLLRSPPEPFQMTYEDRDLQRTVGRHVATLLAQQTADRKLTESRQFDAFNRFAAFVMHDLKNSVAQLQLLVANAEKHRRNPEFMDDAIETIGNTAARMTRLIEQLQSPDKLAATRPVRLLPLLQAVAERAATRPPGLQCSLPANDDRATPIVQADADRLGAVLDHVVRNAQDATGGSGNVALNVVTERGWARIAVQDDGPGMDMAFVRDRLFRPFDSTKGSKGMGIGAYQTREYVRQLGGEVEVQSSPGTGTRFLIKLPLC